MSDHPMVRWVAAFAESDPTFAAASRIADATDRAWQSATYLLTSDRDLWPFFGPTVLRDRSLQAVEIEALALFGYTADRVRTPGVQPKRWWRPPQTDLLVWASFCWTDRWFDGPTVVPRGLDSQQFERWLSALWLHKDHSHRPGLLR